MSASTKGFTLIELLVVIAIIAILAGLLFPVFARAKAAAGDAKTISNVRQLAMAYLLYINDSDDVYAPAVDGKFGTGLIGGWIFYSVFGGDAAGTFDPSKGVIFPYVTSALVYQSSADKDAPKSHNSFAFNGYLAPSTGTGFNPAVSSTSVQYPATTMLLGEEGCGEPALIGYGYVNGTNDGYFNPAVDHFAEFHPGGAAIAFCDGHAKIVQAADHFVETVCGTTVQCF
jgi:prepilin-type N-terminal cleavage/methylation domain-containing protein/prepilin-type processing-associated H-X9-DG protein